MKAIERVSFWLGQLKLSSKLSLEEIQVKTGVSTSTLSRTLTLTNEISIENLDRIATGFNLSICDFFEPLDEKKIDAFRTKVKKAQE